MYEKSLGICIIKSKDTIGRDTNDVIRNLFGCRVGVNLAQTKPLGLDNEFFGNGNIRIR